LFDIDNTHIEICYQRANLFVKQEKLDKAIEVLEAVFGKNNKTDFQCIVPTGLKTALLINQAYFYHPHSIDYQNKPRLASHNLED
jgi:hypothetical protein